LVLRSALQKTNINQSSNFNRMKKAITIFVTVSLISFVLPSCGGDKSESATTTADSLVKQVSEVKPETVFVIKSSDASKTDNPSSEISLSFEGKLTQISTIAGNATITEKADYPAQEIPENALSACGAWWAGGGDYFYVVPSESGLTVYQGWQDEGQGAPGYHWKKLIDVAK
jgi:hypothetical protein